MKPDHAIEIASDVRMPAVGFGTYLIRKHHAHDLVATALRAGYRHVDTAEAYRNEEAVGTGLHAFLLEADSVREDVFVTTKLWPGDSDRGKKPKDKASVIAALDTSLSKLRLDYVDLYLIHAPFNRARRLEQWEALLELRQQGKARAVGVSNFSQTHLEEIKNAGLAKPAVNQIELHPWSPKNGLTEYLQREGIVPVAYSSLVPLSTWRAEFGQRSAKTDSMIADGEDSNSPFRRMARKYSVSEAQVLLRWALQKGYPVLPKSVHPARIRENRDLFGFSIDEEDMRQLGDLDRGPGVAWSACDPTNAP